MSVSSTESLKTSNHGLKENNIFQNKFQKNNRISSS